MSDLVPHTEIERIVGASRHESHHYARAVTAEQTVYILHSRQCLTRHRDLRDCRFSRALDLGISAEEWAGFADRPVRVVVYRRRLVLAKAALAEAVRHA